MIPQFDEQGVLPPGIYDTSLEEITLKLGGTQQREKLISGLDAYLRIWDESGFLSLAIIDGSFVTGKTDPCDIDIILAPKPEALFSYEYKTLMIWYAYDRFSSKNEFGCDVFIAANQVQLDGWIDYFSRDEFGTLKGMLRIRFPL